MKSKVKIRLARDFRKAPTRSEQIMRNILRGNNILNYYFRRQHVIDGYIIDFYCVKLKLALEIDGDIHEQHVKEDKERQEVLEKRGIKFFRVKSCEVEENINGVIKKLKEYIGK